MFFHRVKLRRKSLMPTYVHIRRSIRNFGVSQLTISLTLSWLAIILKYYFHERAFATNKFYTNFVFIYTQLPGEKSPEVISLDSQVTFYKNALKKEKQYESLALDCVLTIVRCYRTRIIVSQKYIYWRFLCFCSYFQKCRIYRLNLWWQIFFNLDRQCTCFFQQILERYFSISLQKDRWYFSTLLQKEI